MPSSGLIVVDDGRKAVAELIKAQTHWMGIGNLITTAPWPDTILPPNFDATAIKLENELTRRKCDLISYVVSDPMGDIVTDTGENFSLVTDNSRSNLLLMRFLFLPPTAQEIDYQIGVFMNNTPNMTKAAMSMQVNSAVPGQPVPIGSTQFQADTLVGGTLADLMPVPDNKLKPGYGRRFKHTDTFTYVITKVDFGSSIIYIERTPNGPAGEKGFSAPVPDNTTISVDAITGVPDGQKQIAPTEMFNPGDLFVARNIQPVMRSPGVRTQFDLVISI